MDDSQDSEKLVDDLNEAMKTLNELLISREAGKSDYWARKTKQINKVFFIFYVFASLLFLFLMFSNWIAASWFIELHNDLQWSVVPFDYYYIID